MQEIEWGRKVMLQLGVLLNTTTPEKQEGVKGVQVIAKRWIVERTNAWIISDQGLVKDYEHNLRILYISLPYLSSNAP